MDVWREVAGARLALADRIDQLPPSALDGPSWCGTWRGRDVLGHLVYLAEATQAGVWLDIVRLGPVPDRALDRRARQLGSLPVPDLTARLRAGVDGRFRVLGSPPGVVLGEVLVHGADLLRPAGADLEVDPAAVVPVLSVYRRIGRFAFHGSPASEVTLVATDADASIGSGPEVRGRAIDLLLLLANRRQAVADLDGPGVASLRLPAGPG